MHEIDALGRPGALVLGVAGAVYLARVLWVSWRDVREHRTLYAHRAAMQALARTRRL